VTNQKVTFEFGDDGSCRVKSWGDTPEKAKQAAQWADKRLGDIIAGWIKEPMREKIK
jgi:hypothetical protein